MEEKAGNLRGRGELRMAVPGRGKCVAEWKQEERREQVSSAILGNDKCHLQSR